MLTQKTKRKIATVLTNFNVHMLFHILFPKRIPIIIVNFNQLKSLEVMVTFFLERGFRNVVIIDNCSTYPPLLDYYQKMGTFVKIIRLKTNDGHMVLFKNKELYQKFCKGLFVLSDPDIIPNEQLPQNFIQIMIGHLLYYYKFITKVGFALRIDNLPDSYSEKQKVLKWESQYWTDEREKDLFFAYLDTTFALYKPYPVETCTKETDFLKAIRLGGNFTAEHYSWYIDQQNLSEEQNYYKNTANSSSSWTTNDKGKTNQDAYHNL